MGLTTFLNVVHDTVPKLMEKNLHEIGKKYTCLLNLRFRKGYVQSSTVTHTESNFYDKTIAINKAVFQVILVI